MNVVVWKLRWKFALTTTFASVIDECGKTGSQKLMSHVIQYSVDQTPFSFSFPRQRHWIKRKSWKQFMSLFLCYYFWQNLESLSSHVRESVLRNPGNFCSWRIRNPGIFYLESEYHWRKPESPLTIEIRISRHWHRIRNAAAWVPGIDKTRLSWIPF